MKKPTQLTVTIDLPENHGATMLSVQSDGSIKLFDVNGNEVNPVRAERSMQYERAKGPKHQTKTTSVGSTVSVGGLKELASLDHFIVIDTNSKQILGKKISAAFFICCRVKNHGDKYKLESLDDLGHVYEFHNPKGNPEMLAILRIQNDISKSTNDLWKSAFITDSELGRHERISSRQEPVYGNQFLKENFTLIYASSDTGQELINRLIRFCDTESTKHLQKIEREGIKNYTTSPLPEEETTQYRFMSYRNLEIINAEITGVELTSDSTASIKFERYFN
jgi:hypothetical protein